jgi:hypothetical protein
MAKREQGKEPLSLARAQARQGSAEAEDRRRQRPVFNEDGTSGRCGVPSAGADSFDGADRCKTPQISPAVAAVEIARVIE